MKKAAVLAAELVAVIEERLRPLSDDDGGQAVDFRAVQEAHEVLKRREETVTA